MKRFTYVWVLFLLSAGVQAGASEPTRIALGLHEGERISGALIEDDGSALVAVSSLDDRPAFTTRFVDIRQGEAHEVSLPDFALNRLERMVSSGTGVLLFAAGAARYEGEDEPVYSQRLVEVQGGEVKSLWDSHFLPLELRQQDPFLRLSQDGRLWGAVYPEVADRSVRLVIGSTEGYELASSTLLDVALMSDGAGEASRSTDFPGLVFLETGSSPLVAVKWAGAVHLIRISGTELDMGKLEASLGIPGEVVWQAEARVLWVHWPDAWRSYELPEALTNDLPEQSIQASSEVPLRLGGQRARVQPLMADGLIRWSKQGAGGLRLEHARSSAGDVGARLSQARRLPSVEESFFSPRGRYALGLPRGAQSDQVLVIQLP